MTDPLDDLRLTDEPVAPRAEFAVDLRRRLAAALGRPGDGSRSGVAAGSAPAARAGTVVPYLCVHDASAALDFYVQAFAAVEHMRVVGDDGRVGHLEFGIGEARFMMSDEYPEIDVVAPRTLGGTTFAVHLEVADVDATYERAAAAGATGIRAPADQTHGNRNATVLDPFGHRWMLSQPVEEIDLATYAAREREFTVSAPRSPVELGYVTMHTGDVGRADRFFGELFAWRLEPGAAGPGHAHVANTRLPMGFAPPAGGPPALHFRVDDVDLYALRVEALGGRVLSRDEWPSGRAARCVDDQDMAFELFEPGPGY